MRLRRRFGFVLAALLGAAVVVLPAVAGSETGPTIDAVNGPAPSYSHSWQPPQATVAAGGTVTLRNLTPEFHGVEWRSPPATPSCTSGIPLSTSKVTFAKEWSGTCTFTQPGTYTYWCTYHGSAMAGTITVSPGATTTTPSTPSTQSTTYGGGSTTTNSATSTEPASQPMSGSTGSTGSPLAGSASQAVKLGSSQRGKSVRGSVTVSPAGAGGRLEVDLLAKRASLAGAGHSGQVRVGRLVRSSLKAGTLSFTVPLNAKARHALRVHRRLALTVRVSLSPLQGALVTVARNVAVHS